MLRRQTARAAQLAAEPVPLTASKLRPPCRGKPDDGDQQFDDRERQSQVFHCRSPDVVVLHPQPADSGANRQFITDGRDAWNPLTATNQQLAHIERRNIAPERHKLHIVFPR